MTILLLGGTGKTARRIAPILRAVGASPRTAARSGADVRFDWDDTTTHDAALDGADAVYLVPPSLRLDFGPLVGTFLDRAEAAGVRHVTFLSARGVEHLPPEVAMRAVELDLATRTELTHSILRPGWFMQDFDEYIFQPSIAADGILVAPAGDGAEAFVHADDIAEVAAATLLAPAQHAGAEYTLAGPEALTFAQVAERIGQAAGRAVTYVDPPVEQWVADTVAAGIPLAYAELLAGLFGAIRASANAASTDAIERVTGHPARNFTDYLAAPATVAAWGVPALTT